MPVPKEPVGPTVPGPRWTATLDHAPVIVGEPNGEEEITAEVTNDAA